jgi:hypothetical protein
MKWSDFFATKDGMIEPTCTLFQKWKEEKHPVTHLMMDNAGENMKLIERCKSSDWKLGIKKFELTARDTPQQNSLAEVGFATLYNRGRAMMHGANIPDHEWNRLMPKAFGLATKLDALVIVKINDNKKTRYEHFHNESAPYLKFLRIFGEAGTVKLKTKTTPKMLNKGVTCMFIGFPENHDGECWLMYNPKTRGVHATRDVVWLRRMYYQKAIQAPEIVPITEEESSEDGEGGILNSEDDADSVSQTGEANQDSDNNEDTNPFADAIPEVYHDDSNQEQEETNDNNEGS